MTPSPSVLIVNTGLGNFGSLRNMYRRIGVDAMLSDDPADVEQAPRIVLPGVGSFDAGMNQLRDRGLVGPLTDRWRAGTPILGVCLGMQLMTRGSEEGSEPGLGWIAADTIRFPSGDGLRIPHMGWNAAVPASDRSVFAGADEDARYYFVHSYHVVCDDDAHVLAWTDYGVRFASAIHTGSLAATQFHPEKSHRFGMHVLRTFLEMT
jgi:imidazole glycerol-phosphate synthase subunit HisH